MLALKQALSLVSTKNIGGGEWNPIDEASLLAWYKNKTGISLNGTDVKQWSDSSTNSFDLVQNTDSEQPAYNASNGELTFVPGDSQNLQTDGTQISISGAFTVAFRANPNTFSGAILADNTTTNEFLKYFSSSSLRIKIDGVQQTLTLDSGTFGDNYIVITRDSSDVIKFYKDGVLQADSDTIAGTMDIDAIGVRATDNSPYDGTVSDVQIYTSEDSALSANINTYLSNI
jgi:hypothetical protein